MPTYKKQSRKRLILIVAFLGIVLTLVFLAYVFPVSHIGQAYLGRKAYHKFNVNFQAINQDLATLPKSQAVFYNGPFCTDLSLHEPDPGEHGWIEECSVTKVWYINVAKADNLKPALARVNSQLISSGWRFENLSEEKRISVLPPIQNGSSTYRKNESHSRSCFINFYYDSSLHILSAPLTLTIEEECGYYYRSILDL